MVVQQHPYGQQAEVVEQEDTEKKNQVLIVTQLPQQQEDVL